MSTPLQDSEVSTIVSGTLTRLFPHGDFELTTFGLESSTVVLEGLLKEVQGSSNTEIVPIPSVTVGRAHRKATEFFPTVYSGFDAPSVHNRPLLFWKRAAYTATLLVGEVLRMRETNMDRSSPPLAGASKGTTYAEYLLFEAQTACVSLRKSTPLHTVIPTLSRSLQRSLIPDSLPTAPRGAVGSDTDWTQLTRSDIEAVLTVSSDSTATGHPPGKGFASDGVAGLVYTTATAMRQNDQVPLDTPPSSTPDAPRMLMSLPYFPGRSETAFTMEHSGGEQQGARLLVALNTEGRLAPLWHDTRSSPSTPVYAVSTSETAKLVGLMFEQDRSEGANKGASALCMLAAP
jgi:hypothetical protein